MSEENDESPNWEATVPEGWTSEPDEESIVFFDPDAELGTVQISSLCGGAPVTDEDLLDFADDLIAEGKRFSSIEIGSKRGLMFRYYAQEELCKEWYLAEGACMFFVTYTCPRSAEGVEDEEVVQILESLRIVG